MTGLMAGLVATMLAASTPLVPVGGGNALTLPAHRHLVRLELGNGRSAVLFALQQEGAGGRGLSFYRSDDGARTFRFLAPIQPDASHTDRADLVAVGPDVALVYSYEGPSLANSDRHDVYFQWWRYDAAQDTWVPRPAVRVFDASASQAYSRAELARDSQGRLWVQAFRLEADGGSTAVLSVSTDGGASFLRQADLGRTKRRGGGRLLSLGSRMIFLWAMHDGFEPTRMRLRNDSDPVGSWGPQQDAFSDGIYHGAALSAVADGRGGMHLVYKDESERLQYRSFNGSSFGARTQVDSYSDWALQPAVTRVGDELFIFFNSPRAVGTNYQFQVRTLRNGALGPVTTLDSAAVFKGYPNAIDVLPTSVGEVPAFFGYGAEGGTVNRVAQPRTPTGGEPPPTDGGTPDAGTPTTDAGTPGGGATPPLSGSLLFADDFGRTASDLGAQWSQVAGAWLTNGSVAGSDRDAANLALAPASACRDCEVEARMQSFGVSEVGLALRAQGASRYGAVLRTDGRVELRRYTSTTAFTVLGSAASGLSSASEAFTLKLSAQGAGPVQLTVSVNGTSRLALTDASSSALGAAGSAGLATLRAGIWFDAFRVRALEGAAPAPDAGTPLPDAGTPDAGTPPDAGTSDAGGSLDAGTPPPDAGTADAGTPPAGSLVFADDFGRSASSLGAQWSQVGMWLTNGSVAGSDLDGDDVALATPSTCGDCEVEARMQGFGVPELGLVLRAQGSARYQAVLRSSGQLELRRYQGSTFTVLATGASGLADPKAPFTLALSARGDESVALGVSVNGVVRLSATDASSAALRGPGTAGLATRSAGVWFDAFRVRTLAPP
ncbi:MULTISPECIES: exo-alpha-sialidase [Myxococcaceae]|uniref:exo-alpha-sialidase n=1 Tax=Myxococcaceae TaxID=31 RepID=UPI001E4CA1D0|nr:MULTISPECIES: exo-alpha-sialidase [Myxococcaceae]